VQTATTVSRAATVSVGASPSPAWAVSIATTTNGTVTASPSSAATDDTVTLTLTPAEGYEPDAVTAYRTGVESTTVVVTGAGLTRTFRMPTFAVTVKATFKKTQAKLNREAVDAAKAAIEGGIYRVAQATANDETAVRTWLVNTLNVLFGQSHDIRFRSAEASAFAADVMITAVTPAIAGTEAVPSGTNGAFSLAVSLTQGASNATATVVTGVIVATPHAGETHRTAIAGNVDRTHHQHR
jgi:hypothetical protein